MASATRDEARFLTNVALDCSTRRITAVFSKAIGKCILHFNLQTPTYSGNFMCPLLASCDPKVLWGYSVDI